MNTIFSILEYETFSPKSITYKTLINSGDLKLIENVQLTATSQGHYPSHEKLDNIYIKHTSLIRDYLRDYIINHADYDQISLSKSPFIDELKLKNIVRTLTTMFVDK